MTAKAVDKADKSDVSLASWLGIPVYLDSEIVLSLSASLNSGVALESSVNTEESESETSKLRAGINAAPLVSFGGEVGGTNQSAVSASEIRKQTHESIFISVRRSLMEQGLLFPNDESWADSDWGIGDFVEFRAGTTVVPLIQVLSRLRVLTEAFSFAANELSPEVLQSKIPKMLTELRQNTDNDDDAFDFDTFLSLISEAGELSRALAGLISRLEEESHDTGLVDVVMFEGGREDFQDEDLENGMIVVASLDRTYVTTKLLRRLGQGRFGVVGKVLRSNSPNTAFNAFRNSMLGSTNQLPVILSRYTDLLFKLPLLLGDGVNVGDDPAESEFHDFVGSASAIAEIRPLWVLPSVEILPIAIYA